MRTDSRTRGIALIGAGALVIALAGCAATPPAAPAAPGGSGASVSAAPVAASPTPTVRPLACADLVPTGRIVEALRGPASPTGMTAVTTSTRDESLIGVRSVQGAGGLSCAWTTTPSTEAAPAGVLTVSLLPRAAADWSGQLYGDAPSVVRRTFAGVSAAADCGDPGCGASMVVGSTWVRVDMLGNGGTEGPSFIGRESTDTVFAHGGPAIESVIAAVRAATAEQLRFPAHLPAAGTATSCRSVLGETSLAKAMGVATAHYDTRYQPTGLSDSVVGAAEHRIGTLDCFAEDSGSSPDGIARITVDPGQAWAVADLAADPIARGALVPTTIAGQASGERALSSCGAPHSNSCTVILTLHGDAIQIDETPHPRPIAEAIARAAG